MALNTLNSNQISFKKLSGKAHTQQGFAVTEEGITSNVQISYTTLFASEIKPLPVTNLGLTSLYSTNGIVQRIKFVVDIIPNTQIGINQSQGYRLKLPSDWNTYPGALYPEFSAGTYLSNSLGKLQIVPSLYGKLKNDGTTEYDPILYQTNGSTVINKFDSINWYLDTYSGILFVQDPPSGFDISSNKPGFVEAFLFVGDYVDDILNIVSSGSTGTTGINVGGGIGIFKDKVGNDLRFKTIFGTQGIIVTGTTNNVIIGFSGETGGITGATNGITITGKNVKLGGTLTGDTNIIMNANSNFIVADNSQSTTGIYTFYDGLVGGTASGIIVNGKGLQIFENSLTIDSNTPELSITNSTSLSINFSTNNITTSLPLNTSYIVGSATAGSRPIAAFRGNYFGVSNTNGSFSFGLVDNVAQIQMGRGSNQEYFFINVNNTTTPTNGFQQIINSSDYIVTDYNTTKKGIQYAGNYSTGFNKRSLVDVAYVTGLTSSINPKSSFGITGDSSTTNFLITHNKNTRDVMLQVYENQSPYGTVIVDCERTSVNQITIKFAVAPTTGNNYRVVII